MLSLLFYVLAYVPVAVSSVDSQKPWEKVGFLKPLKVQAQKPAREAKGSMIGGLLKW